MRPESTARRSLQSRRGDRLAGTSASVSPQNARPPRSLSARRSRSPQAEGRSDRPSAEGAARFGSSPSPAASDAGASPLRNGSPPFDASPPLPAKDAEGRSASGGRERGRGDRPRFALRLRLPRDRSPRESKGPPVPDNRMKRWGNRSRF